VAVAAPRRVFQRSCPPRSPISFLNQTGTNKFKNYSCCFFFAWTSDQKRKRQTRL
jgi:hypothetical protein